jgi:hypothetical protein
MTDARRGCMKVGGWIFVIDDQGKPIHVSEWCTANEEESDDLALHEVLHDPAEFGGCF